MALGLKKKQKTAGAKKPVPAEVEPPRRMLSPQPAVDKRRRRFIEEYLLSNNAADAARKAGYSPKTARVQGSQLLTDPNIKAELAERRARLAKTFDITTERVLQEVALIAFGRADAFMGVGAGGVPRVDFSKATADERAALESFTVEEFTDGRSDKRQVRRVKFSMHDKVKGLELLMRRLGLLTETVEHKHSVTVMGALLAEIDEASRKTIDVTPVKK